MYIYMYTCIHVYRYVCKKLLLGDVWLNPNGKHSIYGAYGCIENQCFGWSESDRATPQNGIKTGNQWMKGIHPWVSYLRIISYLTYYIISYPNQMVRIISQPSFIIPPIFLMVFQHLEIIKRIGKTKRIPYGYESKSYNYTIVGGLYNSIEIQATLMWKSLGFNSPPGTATAIVAPKMSGAFPGPGRQESTNHWRFTWFKPVEIGDLPWFTCDYLCIYLCIQK